VSVAVQDLVRHQVLRLLLALLVLLLVLHVLRLLDFLSQVRDDAAPVVGVGLLIETLRLQVRVFT